jgi:predicted XRE-type DNA-binding protein
MTKTKAYNNVWDAIESNPVKAENLKFRSSFMVALTRHIKNKGLTQVQAAKVFRVTRRASPTSSTVRSTFLVWTF